MLDSNLVLFNLKAESAEDVLRAANKILFENGYVKESYLQEVLKREEIYPTGLPGKSINIALPHTNPEHILKPGIAVILLENPVNFMMMGSTDVALPCQLILPLAVLDPSAQIDVLKKIMDIIQDAELLENILKATNAEEVLNLLSILESN